MGSGVRRALFIHCSLAHSGAWMGVGAALLDKLSMTAFDRPGHGRSAPWLGGEDGKALHDLTTEIAGQLIDKRADVVGHSYGATVALRLAMEWPEHVRTLTMIEPVLFAAIRGTAEYDAAREMIYGLRSHIERGNRMEAARIFHDATNHGMYFDDLSPERQKRMAARIDLVLEESPATFEDTAGLLEPGRLEKIRQPVLLLESSNPPVGVRAVHEALAARIAHLQRVVVVGAGHMSPITHPENVAGEIAAFLKV
ncbi:alpha/beta hydrolase [Maritimibacter sp. UBA3975]|uniref:alpha/beta fold hydrolase n=1 Tax=Maritimibacter sp. UBA3975 TaxID=1946833 RepID=UPI000C09CF61|nr:alpha/beta hydrolase [Maritimibacter sp. UBA3975]MAM63014.1 alpha/beta hydrolase [Maritimibacter sp.]|tara:strand:+ start:54896 stop:55657 length:762 start_codon:yes stop_codon:yes gene_type:complete